MHSRPLNLVQVLHISDRLGENASHALESCHSHLCTPQRRSQAHPGAATLYLPWSECVHDINTCLPHVGWGWLATRTPAKPSPESTVACMA